jgi:hypothetical protein
MRKKIIDGEITLFKYNQKNKEWEGTFTERELTDFIRRVRQRAKADEMTDIKLSKKARKHLIICMTNALKKQKPEYMTDYQLSMMRKVFPFSWFIYCKEHNIKRLRQIK